MRLLLHLLVQLNRKVVFFISLIEYIEIRRADFIVIDFHVISRVYTFIGVEYVFILIRTVHRVVSLVWLSLFTRRSFHFRITLVIIQSTGSVWIADASSLIATVIVIEIVNDRENTLNSIIIIITVVIISLWTRFIILIRSSFGTVWAASTTLLLGTLLAILTAWTLLSKWYSIAVIVRTVILKIIIREFFLVVVGTW